MAERVYISLPAPKTESYSMYNQPQPTKFSLTVRPSNMNTTCTLCGWKIYVGSELIIEYSSTDWITWYHAKCWPKSSQWYGYAVPTCTMELLLFDKLNENDQQKVMQWFFADQVEKSKRPQLMLTKSLEAMDEKELKIELRKRNLHQYYHGDYQTYNSWWYLSKDKLKLKLQQNLMDYLNNSECQRIYQVIVRGYCRQQNRIGRMQITVELQNIILKYYPSYLLGERMDDKKRCKNCQELIQDSFKFCPHCGTKY